MYMYMHISYMYTSFESWRYVRSSSHLPLHCKCISYVYMYINLYMYTCTYMPCGCTSPKHAHEHSYTTSSRRQSKHSRSRQDQPRNFPPCPAARNSPWTSRCAPVSPAPSCTDCATCPYTRATWSDAPTREVTQVTLEKDVLSEADVLLIHQGCGEGAPRARRENGRLYKRRCFLTPLKNFCWYP